MTKRIVFGQPLHPSFPYHMDCFDALQRAPSTSKRAIAFGEPSAFLHGSVILLDHIIQVLALAQRNATRQRTLGNTLLGARVKDLRTVLAYLSSRQDLRKDQIAVRGDSAVPQNSARLLIDELPAWQIGPEIQH